MVALTVAYSSIAINCAFSLFPDTFFLMGAFIALFCLLEQDDLFFVVFALMASLSRPLGFEFVFLFTLIYGFFFGQLRRVFKLITICIALLAVFAAGVFLIGYAHGLLGVWKTEFRYEFLGKSMDEVPENYTHLGNLWNLLKWWFLGACLLPFGLRIRKADRLNNVLLLVLAVLLLHLIGSVETRIYRVHYVAPLIFITLASFLRVAQDESSGWRNGYRVFFPFIACITALYIIVRPFDFTVYNTVWPAANNALDEKITCIKGALSSRSE
jgi:hypothetical protein